MDYIEIYCRVSPPEPWSGILIADLADIGFESFLEESDGFRAYIPEADYNENRVKALFQDHTGPDSVSYEKNLMGGRNWNAVWESNFSPVNISGRILIRAPFHKSDPDIEHDIIIEPKMSFGTGHHETTVLVAEWLLETAIEGKKVLDMGCGTGILAILAARMGASSVTAIDNYLYAWENTTENAERNGISGMLVLHGDAGLLGDESYDLIIANINRNVLLEDMGAYNRVLEKGGIMFLSGFLSSDRDLISEEAYRQGLAMAGSKQKGDWLSLKLSK